MGRYEVTSEQLINHSAIVDAETEEEALEKYMDGEYVRDLGIESGVETEVFSVREVVG